MSKNARDQIDQWVKSHRVVLLMKGSPEAPLCGFSAAAARLLTRCGVTDFFSFNVLSDDTIRQAAKEYANWPTFPQLYINGELIGGCDIMREMSESGELARLLAQE